MELTVLGVERVREIGGRQSRPGYEFVIVDTSWTNVIPLTPVNKKEQSAGPTAGFGGFGTSKRTSTDPADIEMKPTPYVVPMLAKQMWLFTDGRFADTVDLDAEEAVADRFPKDGFGIAKLDDVVRGKVVFEAPINPTYQAFQFYDTNHGHALIPLTGSEPPRPAAIGPAAENAIVQLAVSEARFLASDDNVVGLRPYMVGVRGVSRSPKDVAVVPARFVFAQTDQGCIASPEPAPEGLSRPFGTEASFPPTGANEAQLVFRVPSRTRAVRVLIRAQNGGPIDLPAGAPFQPAWPTPVRTITDGTVARVHVLPTPGPPVNLPPLNPGRAYQLVDLAVENLHPQSGIELQYAQLRLQASDGTFIDPSPLSSTVPCALPDGGVIPPAATRRFVLVYDIPADAPARRLNYRGFQLEDTTVDVP